MNWLDFSGLGLWPNLGIFAVAAALVWVAGTRVTGYVDAVADRTGMGQAFAGMLILATITSLPEVAAVSTASWTGNAALATNNLLGSVSINIVLIAMADAILGRDAITSAIGRPTTLMQGALLAIALALLAASVVTGDVSLHWFGAWSLALFLYCLFAFWFASRYSKRAPWQTAEDEEKTRPREMAGGEGEGYRRSYSDISLTRLLTRLGLASAIILVAGFFLSQAADGIAKVSGLGAGLVGLVLVGAATSLPEVSSITAAVRLRRYEMALGDVFGTNLLTVGLIFLSDVVYGGGPVLNEAGRFEAVASLLGVVLTGIFLVGLLERENRTVFRMGYDAVAALLVFAAGLVLLYFLQA